MAQANAHPQYAPDDAQKEHFDAIRKQRGWSWETLADYFDQNGQTDPATPHLAAWAREQAKAAPSKRAAKKATEKR